MPRPTSKPTSPSWAALLQQEMAERGPALGGEWVAFDDVRMLFKKQGLPYGERQAGRALRRLIDSGLAEARQVRVVGINGRQFYGTRYRLKA